MKFFIKSVVLAALSFLSITACKAQPKELATNSRKAKEYFEQANKYFRLRYIEDALNTIDKAIEKDEEFIDAYVLKAQLLVEIDDLEQSINYYKKGISIDSTFNPRVYLELAHVQSKALKLDEALETIKAYHRFKEDDYWDGKAEEIKETTKTRKELIENPVDFDPQNLGPGVNNRFFEHSPTLRADGKLIYFTKNQPRVGAMSSSRSEFDEDIYMSRKKGDGTWAKAERLSKSINSPFREGAACISPDGNYIFFTSCGRREGLGSCDLYIASRKGEQWVNPRNLGKAVNTRHWDSQPSFSSDGRTLYFVSNRPGGPGKKDIWMTQIGDDGKWSDPKPVPFNTPGDDLSPYAHPDNKTFYFSSDGYPGMGMRDMFVVEKISADSFGEPRNLGYPINTLDDEVSLSVGADGKKAYYASGMPGGFGKWDLYSFELPKYARPTPVTYARGKVYDKKTDKPLRAKFELIDLETQERVVESYSDPENGEFLVVVPTEKNYMLNASAEGYLFFSENFELSGEKGKDVDNYAFDVAMKPIEKGETVVLKNIFFETDKYKLKPQSKAELTKLVEFLNNNPTLKIEIGGHTDNVGSKDYNQQLSENRAKSVYTYLIDAGINAERLSFKGYNFSEPIASNDKEEGRAQNRRTEFKIIEK